MRFGFRKRTKQTRTLTPFSSPHRPALGHPDGLPALGCPVFVLPAPVPPRPRPLDVGRPVVTRLPRPRPPSSCERQGQRRCQRQNKKNKITKKILPFSARNSGPRNDDGGETGKREAKKRRRKQKQTEKEKNVRSKVKREKNVRSKVKRKTGVVAARPREAAPQLVQRDGSGWWWWWSWIYGGDGTSVVEGKWGFLGERA